MLAYITLPVDAYPPFSLGEHPEYPVQLQIGPPLEANERRLVPW